MKQALALLLAAVLGTGCQRGPAALDTPIPKATPVAKQTPSTELQADQRAQAAETIFGALIAHSWTSQPPGKQGFPLMDYSVASYRADGTWSFEFFTDYHIPAQTGKWNLQFVQGQWYLCRDDGARGPIGLNDDGTLKLGFGKFYPHEPQKREPGQTAKALQPLVLTAEVQEIVKRLTAQTWKRANDLDLFMDPTQVRFRPDWTYAATYRGGECKSEGTWYAKIDEIVAHSPQGRCDRPSDTSSGDSLTVQVIDDRQILINSDLYVPEDEPVPRGIIWHLFGFDAANTRIEYDMPIRRGQPVRFDVTITNRSSEPLKLERFALSREYSDYGRSLGVPGMKAVPPEDEIVAHDLAGMALAPGKSHAFHVLATFAEAGTPTVYFNVLVSGSTQNWDTHQAHWPTVAK